MPAFRFRLSTVLRYRERNREEQRLAFAAVEEEKTRLVAEITRLERLLAMQAQEMAQADGQLFTGTDLQLQGEFAQSTMQQVQKRRMLLVAVEQKLDAQQAILLQADRDVKSLEQLKRRWQERHRRQENAEEQRHVDAVGQRRYLDQKK